MPKWFWEYKNLWIVIGLAILAAFVGVAIIQKPEEHHAIKLGIEALKRIEYCRSGHFNELFKLLPGETEE